VATISVTAWYPRDNLPGKGLWCNSPRSTATTVLPSLLRERQAMTLDEGASGFGGYAEAFGDLSVGELFGRHD
jgi:hypothetical protein